MPENATPTVDEIKSLLATNSRPAVHDGVFHVIQKAVETSAGEAFSVCAPWGQDEFRHRVSAYDELFRDCVKVQGLLAWWGDSLLRGTLTLAIKRVCDSLTENSGNGGWLALRWYPPTLLFYAAGIAAVASERYENLFALMHARVTTPDGRSRQRALCIALVDGTREISSAFKMVEGLVDRYTPMSDHLFATLRAPLDEVLHLGSDYERCFDQFEVFLGLEHLHLAGDGWAPIGRFGWKSAYRESSPMHLVIDEAARSGTLWPPLSAGLFGQSSERATALGVQLKAVVERRQMY